MSEEVKRCTGGFDNAGVCSERSDCAGGWHYDGSEHLHYGYDRCRREAGHESDISLPYHEWCLPDCGGAIMMVRDTVDTDYTTHWHTIYDMVNKSGERLVWK